MDARCRMQDLDIQIQYGVLRTYLSTGVSHPSQIGVVMDAIIAISVDYDPHCQFTHPKKRHLRTKNPTVSVFIHG